MPLSAIGEPLVPMDDPSEALRSELEKDFERLKRQKCRPSGGVEGTTLTNLCFLNDEQYVNYKEQILSLEPQDANKLYLTFNLIAPLFYKLLGRLAAFNAPFKAQPDQKGPKAMSLAEVVDRLIVALDDKLDEPSKLRETLFWMGAGGAAFRYITWVPNYTIEPTPQFQNGELLYKDLQSGEVVPESYIAMSGRAPEEFEIHEEIERVGEIGDEVLGPFNVFVDHGVKSLADLAPDQWVHIARIKTVGWIKENFGVDVEPQKSVNLISSRILTEGTATGGVYLKDLVPMVQGTTDETDPGMVVFIVSYRAASDEHPHGREVYWIPQQLVLHDGPNPYEEIPLIDFHFTPVTTSFWTKAYITPLISPQRFINKRMSQLGEQANATIYANLLLGPQLTEKDIPADYPGVIMHGLTEEGVPQVARVPPPEIPQWFLESIKLAVSMLKDAAGGTDLFDEQKFPGQLRGPLAVPMLQEILDTQWGPLFAHLGERLGRVKQVRLNRVKQFYPPVRTLHYTDRSLKDEVLTFHSDKVLRSGTNFTVKVERGSLLPELRSLREARVRERLQSPLAILYMDERTGRMDKSKIAADLQFGDTGREARESKYRKLGQEIAKMLWEGTEIPPVQPFYDHRVMLDELEAEMATTEFMRASPSISQAFSDRWMQHVTYLREEASMQQQAMQGQMIQNAVAQATQQAAATAAAQAVESANDQIRAQQGLPTESYVAAAGAKAAGPSKPRPRPVPFKRG